jgi:hypothetical protein
MLSSNDVAAMFSAQGQNFAQQNYYAQTVGISNPAMSIGAYRGTGIQSGFQPAGPSFPGVRPPPPSFSYANGGAFGPGYGSGNNVAGHMMSGMGAAATLGGIGMGMMIPGLDPISGFMGGMKAAGGFGMRGVMGGMGAAALPLAGAMLAAHTVGSFVGGGQQQAQIANQLGGFQFNNPASRTGQGFTRQDSSDIGSSIRSMAHIPDMLTSVEELTRLLPTMRRAGVMSGVKDAAEFNRRFKETVTTLRDMSKMMGTTMEEASQFFEHNRQIGMSGKTSQLRNTLNAQFTSGMTGMTMGQTMGMQQGGAQIARQFGARGASGAQGVTNMAQGIQGALEAGFLDQDTLTDVTGLQGAEAVGAASQKMYGFMANLSQTAPGRLIMAGAMTRGKDGKVKLDEELIKKLNRGEITVDQLKARAGSLSDNDKISFAANAKNLGGQFAGQVDLPKFMQGLVGGKGQEAASLLLQQYSGGQMSESDVSLMTSMGKGNQGVDMESFKGVRSREMQIRESTDPEIMWKRLKTKMHNATFGRAEKAGADVYSSIGKMYDNFIDDLVGRHVVALSKEGAKALQQGMSGAGGKEMRDMFAAAHGLKPGSDIGSSFGESGFANTVRGWGAASGTSGLTSFGQNKQAAGLVGAGGSLLAKINDLADSGRLVTAAGKASAEDLRMLKVKINKDTGGGFNEADHDVRSQMTREGMAKVIAASMREKGYGVTSNGDDGVADLEGMLLSGDTKGIESLTGKSMADLGADLGDTAGGRFVRTGVSHRTEKGGLMNDFLSGALHSTEQNVMKVSAREAAGGSAVSKYIKTRDIDSLRKDAESELGNLSGDSRAIVRGSANVRSIALGMLQSKTKKDQIEAILHGNDNGEDRALALSKIGVAVSSQEADQLYQLTLDSGFTKAEKGISMFHAAGALGDKWIGENKMGDVAKGLREGIGALKEGEKGSPEAGIAGALSTAASAYSADWNDKTAKGWKGALQKTIASYQGADDEGKKKLLKALGPAAAAAIQSAAGVEKNLSGLEGSQVTMDQLVQRGMSPGEVLNAAPGAAENGVNLTPSMISKLAGSRAASGLAGSYGAKEGAAETGREMVKVLKDISANSDKSVALMTVVAAQAIGLNIQGDANETVNSLRANYGKEKNTPGLTLDDVKKKIGMK